MLKAAEKCEAEKREVASGFCEGPSQVQLQVGMRSSLGTCMRWEKLQKRHCVTEGP